MTRTSNVTFYALMASLLCISLLGIILFSLTAQAVEEANIAQYSYQCNITMIIQGDVSNLSDVNEVMLFPNTSRQKVYIDRLEYFLNNLSIKLIGLKTDEDGNVIAVFNISPNDLKIGDVIFISFKVTIIQELKKVNISLAHAINSTFNEIPNDLLRLYTGNASTWPIPACIYDLAKSLAENCSVVMEVLERFSKWIEDNIAYPLNQTSRKWIGPQYPLETYSYKVGDCDDSSILFITMCRAIGLPAFLQLGCIPQFDVKWHEVVMHNGNYIHKFKGVGWHAWSMVFIPRLGWMPVDLTYFSGAKYEPANFSSAIYIRSYLGVKPKIKYSAYYIANPILYANFSTLRYVDNARSWEQAIAGGRLKYMCAEELSLIKLVNVKEASRVPIPIMVPAVACIAFFALLITCYFRLKRRQTMQ